MGDGRAKLVVYLEKAVKMGGGEEGQGRRQTEGGPVPRRSLLAAEVEAGLRWQSGVVCIAFASLSCDMSLMHISGRNF